jgi:hypothetical protein
MIKSHAGRARVRRFCVEIPHAPPCGGEGGALGPAIRAPCGRSVLDRQSARIGAKAAIRAEKDSFRLQNFGFRRQGGVETRRFVRSSSDAFSQAAPSAADGEKITI